MINLSCVAHTCVTPPAEVSGSRAQLRLRVPAEPHEVSSCHRTSQHARGAEFSEKWKEKESLRRRNRRRRRSTLQNRYLSCFWKSLSTGPHQRTRPGLMLGFACGSPGSFPFQVGPHRTGFVLIRPSSTSATSQTIPSPALTLFRAGRTFCAAAKLIFSKVAEEAQPICFAGIKRREPPWPAALPLKWRYGEGSSERAFSRTHHR